MKAFSKAEIDGVRNYFKSKGFEEVNATIGSRSFSYFVLPQSLEPKMQGFAFRCTGNIGDGYVFGIADSVPAEFRNYAVAHEFIEFAELGIDAPDRCVRSLEQELKLVPDGIKVPYVLMRRDFFRNLVQYCRDSKDFTKADVNELEKSLSRLEEITKQVPI